MCRTYCVKLGDFLLCKIEEVNTIINPDEEKWVIMTGSSNCSRPGFRLHTGATKEELLKKIANHLPEECTNSLVLVED